MTTIDEIMPLRLSKSKVADFDRCPKYFYYVHIEGRKEPPSLELIKGKELHEIFDKFYDNLKSLTVSKELLMETMQKVVSGYPSSPKYTKELKNFLNFNLNILEKTDPKYFYPVMRESKIYDEKYDIVGVVDCVFEDENSILLLDYKSDKPRDQKPDNSKYRFELSLYKYLLDTKTSIRCSHWGILHVSISDKPWVEKANNEYFDEIVFPKVCDIRQNIISGTFAMNRGSGCKSCPFYQDCMREEAKAFI